MKKVKRQKAADSSSSEETFPVKDLTGCTLGDFQVLRRLGQGGMGQVYLARQLSLKRKVALKTLKPELAANTNSLKRFRAEAEAVAKITHANIVQVHAIGDFEGLHYMVLEYVEGRNLKEYLHKKGPPDVTLGLSIMRQVTAALVRAAEVGIVHRDIKPENILLTSKGEVKVADFGLSRCFAGDTEPLTLTQTGVTMGTPMYMSPEQVQGQPVDPRSDIYSFGVTCYHMLSGNPPFRGNTPFEVSLQHVQGTAKPLHEVRPDLPAELCSTVDKMMAKKPEERFQTARELAKELGRLREKFGGSVADLELTPSTPTPGPSPSAPSPPTSPRKPQKKRRPLVWLVPASVVLVLGTSAGVSWIMHRQAASTVPSQLIQPHPNEPSDEVTQQDLHELLNLFNRYAKPKEEADANLGVSLAIDIGAVYIGQWRQGADLEDAHHFFERLENTKKAPMYVALGRLGRGVLYALQNNPAMSNAYFKKADLPRLPERVKGPLLESNKLQRMLAEALRYNAANGDPTRDVGLTRVPERLK